MDSPPKYECNEDVAAAAMATLQHLWSTERQQIQQTSAQSPPSTTIRSSDQPFRVALIMSRVSNAYIDSKGALHSSKPLKVKCGSVTIRHDTTEAEFRQLLWECIYDTFGFRGWMSAPRTDAELASGKKFATADEWAAVIARLAKEKDTGQDPVLRFSFSWKKWERVKSEAGSELSFSLKSLLSRVSGR